VRAQSAVDALFLHTTQAVTEVNATARVGFVLQARSALRALLAAETKLMVGDGEGASDSGCIIEGDPGMVSTGTPINSARC
jgi:hypothetical protein